MKANFKLSKDSHYERKIDESLEKTSDLTKQEFEDFIVKSGAKGSFMIYRSDKKDEELGIDQL